MSKDYEVGYGKPPKEHRFKAGNQAAKRRRSRKKKALSMPEIIDEALRSTRKIKRGNQVFDEKVGKILAERLIQAMVSGSIRDLTLIVGLIERYLPEAMAAPTETLEIIHHHAEGSSVTLPPADLWKAKK